MEFHTAQPAFLSHRRTVVYVKMFMPLNRSAMTLFCHFNVRKVHHVRLSVYVFENLISQNIVEPKLFHSGAVRAVYLLLVQSLIMFFIVLHPKILFTWLHQFDCI